MVESTSPMAGSCTWSVRDDIRSPLPSARDVFALPHGCFFLKKSSFWGRKWCYFLQELLQELASNQACHLKIPSIQCRFLWDGKIIYKLRIFHCHGWLPHLVWSSSPGITRVSTPLCQELGTPGWWRVEQRFIQCPKWSPWSSSSSCHDANTSGCRDLCGATLHATKTASSHTSVTAL